MPGSLNKGFMMGDSSFEKILVIAVFCIRSDRIKNGKSEGITIENQSVNPFFVEFIISEGEVMQNINKIKIIAENI